MIINIKEVNTLSYIKKTMINSNSFPHNKLEDISAFCLRDTLAVKKYKEVGDALAQKELNHKNSGTTLSHYIIINEKNIFQTRKINIKIIK